jgi:hypothetical protein
MTGIPSIAVNRRACDADRPVSPAVPESESQFFESIPIKSKMRARPTRKGLRRYTGYCRFSGESDALATLVQILLRTRYFTDTLSQRSGTIFKLFLKLYDEMTNSKQWLDIDPLIKMNPSVLAGKSELTDCFSGLFRLFGSPIPHISPPAGVVFHIPHENSIVPYFSALDADTISNLGVIFFDTRSVVLGHIPETLGDFTLYVVVNRLSKTSSHLCFRDIEVWLSIRGNDIEEAPSFRPGSISFLGYIRDRT